MSYIDGRHVVLGELGPDQLSRFWKQLVTGRRHQVDSAPSQGSLQQSRRIVSAFLRWCVTQRHASVELLAELDRWSLPRPKKASRATRPRHAQAPIGGLVHIQNLDAAAAALSFWTGATPGELASLEVTAFDWNQSLITIQRRDSRSTVVLPEALTADLRAIVTDGRTFLFNPEHAPSAASVAQRISRWAARQHTSSTSARRLRARFLDLAKDAGWSSDEIRGQLRRLDLPLATPQPPTLDRLAAIENLSGPTRSARPRTG
ncbi:hypothetical protein [Dyella sp. EPa41]|uniref:hypothetical protein n=1 Tax=Dyella sp. EPa41 TaxID=1561194 RepID=UPI00191688BA|nr:hypothetical protein [Dyella sp. EPa41]